jgi:hypothetical protein
MHSPTPSTRLPSGDAEQPPTDAPGSPVPSLPSSSSPSSLPPLPESNRYWSMKAPDDALARELGAMGLR